MYPIIQDYTVLYNTQNMYSSLSCIHFVTFNVCSDVHVNEAPPYFHPLSYPLTSPTVSLWLLSVCCLSLSPSSLFLSLFLSLSLLIISLSSTFLFLSFSFSFSCSDYIVECACWQLTSCLVSNRRTSTKIRKKRTQKKMYHIKNRNWLLGTIFYTCT